jgi:hypothetical protein
MTFGADYHHPERFEILEALRPHVGKWIHEYYDKWEKEGRPSLVGQNERKGLHEILNSYSQFEKDKVKGILYLTCSQFLRALGFNISQISYKRGMTLVYRYNLKKLRKEMREVKEKVKAEKEICNAVLSNV